MSSYRIASRYAKSLIDLAIAQDKLDRILDDVTYFSRVCEVRDVELLLKSPVVKADKKGRVLKALFSDKVDPLTHSFFDIILRKGRESKLPEIAAEFIRQYRDIKGISIVEIVSAETLSTEMIQSIRQKLIDSKLTKPNIEFKTSVDPALIGGFVISFEDKLYDASVRHQLDLLHKEFSSDHFQTTS